ncbi:uncharacterized protein I303_103279 [Kwoniella dejecticola CBS 10117]|uniref:Uncharacterized protein n=1 Tax=Kwoniella dejecticola CBS 10117 TaxID=1296121 RepID=A0A1A6A6A5_9TREE|nr:uncharacterized protein I303_03302 [Kwoniella dejecticola CBS 10117]OBR85591.1 hypothetical protein I303_03302 [Kwoniella dejecticola CBS 10117]
MTPSSSKISPLSPVDPRSPTRSPPATLDQATVSSSLSLSLLAMDLNSPPNEQQPRQPRFYLPSTSNSSPRSSPVAPLSRVQSGGQADILQSGIGQVDSLSSPVATTTSSSVRRAASNGSSGSGLYERKSSRASINNLRSALELYQIHPTTTLPQSALLSPDFVGDGGGPSALPFSGYESHVVEQTNQGYKSDSSCNDGSDRSSHTHHSSISSEDLGNMKMDALVDIHRVLYRGKEDLQVRRIELCFKEELKQVRRVVERWFESDCIYEQPLVRLTSRETILMHFALLHVFGSVYIPSFTPVATIIHIQELVHLLKTYFLGIDDDDDSNQTSKPPARTAKLPQVPNAPNPGREEQLLGLGLGLDAPTRPSPQPAQGLRTAQDSASDLSSQTRNRGGEPHKRTGYQGWWKLWDITAECKEIGEMECYDGHYLAMIEHVLRLSLLPNLRNRSEEQSATHHPSAYFHPATGRTAPTFGTQQGPRPQARENPRRGEQGIPAVPLPSFARRLIELMWAQVECWLDWDLRVNTIVQFNEVGKATHLRDVVDIRDLVEFVVPFAKRLRWITKSIGIFTSIIGAIILAILEDHKESKPKSTVKAVQVTVQRQRSQPVAASQPAKYIEKTSTGKENMVSPVVPLPVYDEKPSHSAPSNLPSAPTVRRSPLMSPERSQPRSRRLSAPTPNSDSPNVLGLENISPPKESKQCVVTRHARTAEADTDRD